MSRTLRNFGMSALLVALAACSGDRALATAPAGPRLDAADGDAGYMIDVVKDKQDEVEGKRP